MSTWHLVVVNITTNQSGSVFKISLESSQKKKVVQLGELNWQPHGE
jgi:hypothetical protein